MDKMPRIIPPDGYVIDEEKSDDDVIMFKKVKPMFRYDPTRTIYGYVINEMGKINDYIGSNNAKHVFAEFKHADSALAMAQITQIIKNDERYGGEISTDEWNDNSIIKYGITKNNNNVVKIQHTANFNLLAFHTEIQRDLFMKDNIDLIENYLMIEKNENTPI